MKACMTAFSFQLPQSVFDYLEYFIGCAMVNTVVEVEDLLKTGLGRLVFTLNLWVKDVALVHE